MQKNKEIMWDARYENPPIDNLFVFSESECKTEGELETFKRMNEILIPDNVKTLMDGMKFFYDELVAVYRLGYIHGCMNGVRNAVEMEREFTDEDGAFVENEMKRFFDVLFDLYSVGKTVKKKEKA